MRLAILLLLFAGDVCGQSVTLPKELNALPGEWIVVVPEAVDGGAPRWRWSPALEEVRLDALFGPDLAKQARGKVFRTRTVGTHIVEAWNAKGDQASAISACSIRITAQTSEPPPAPPDKPAPPPDKPAPPPPDKPAPAGAIWAVVIRPDAPITPEQQKNFLDPAWARLEAAGVKVMNKSMANVKEPSLREEVKGITLPAFMVLRETPAGCVTVVTARPLPTATEIERLTREALKP